MRLSVYSLLLSLLLSSQVHAVKCYFTLVKENCWKSYDLTVDVLDAKTRKVKATLMVPENRLWYRQEFECKPGDTLALVAKFSPIFWAGDENKTFSGQRYWKLPETVKPGETGWNVTVCFPKSFANVPLPPDATGSCTCDVASIPKPDPEKIESVQ